MSLPAFASSLRGLQIRTPHRYSLHCLKSVIVGLTFHLALPSVLSAEQPATVVFDAPAIIVAEPINPAVVEAPTMGGQLMRLRFAVSSQTAPEFRGQVNEVIVEIENPQRLMRVLDYWPKTQVYSEVEGTIAIENQARKDNNFAFNVSGAYEPFARGNASGDFHRQQTVNERYAKKPPVQLLSSSGTVGRGYGVFYRFRSGPVPVANGGHEVALLVEVPSGWRADLLHISLRAVGISSSSFPSSHPEELGTARLWMVVHQADDEVAAQHARRYVAQEQTLRALAAKSQPQIESRSYPTVFHKVGVALDVIHPKIPSDYLTQVLFGANTSYFTETTNRLPVDLRVAILDYWDQRKKLLSLSRAHRSNDVSNEQTALRTATQQLSDIRQVKDDW